MSNIRTKAAVVTGCLVLSVLAARAQTPISNLVVTVGTSIQDTSGNYWSYVLLGSPQGQLLAGKQFAIYGKAGYRTNAGTFTLRGTAFQQTEPKPANALLNQSVALGENLASLGTVLDTLLHNVPGIASQTLGQKVITAFQTAATNPNTASVLALLAHVNPGLTLCAGQGFSEEITSVTTYEVREVNLATGVAGEVLGRVTIVPGSPVVLPAPGFPFQVVSNSPSDHLRVRLRWGTSDAFRRLSLLSYGFNVWRIPLANAVAAGYSNTPPTLNQLYTDRNFTLANQAPVIATKDFSTGHGTGAADDPADQTTYFFSDQNGYTGLSNSPPAFADGQQFYYFITARDVLGRDGLVSPGAMGEAFRRIPPQAPTYVRVQNVYHLHPTNQQSLMITWLQDPNVNDLVGQYWIYRWPNPGMFLTNNATPSNGLVGVVMQLPGTNTTNSFTDNGTNGPLTPGLSNYWYTVRAVSIAAAGPLLSPDSVPAWGVLRERFGPAATTGQILGSCGTPAVIFENFNTITNTGPPDTNHWDYRFTCQRRDPGTAWVEFLVTNQYGEGLTLGPIYFPPSGDTLSVEYSPSIVGTNDPATVACVAGSFYGMVSSPALVSLPAPTSTARLESVFLAGEVMLTSLSSSDPLAAVALGNQRCLPGVGPKAYPDGTVRMYFDTDDPAPRLVQAETGGITYIGWLDVGIATRGADGYFSVYYPACLLGPLPNFQGCLVNLPGEGTCSQAVTRGAPSGPVNPILISFVLTPRTHEYRLYRTVDGGPLTLIAQSGAIYDDSDPFRTIVCKDDTMPPSVARLCYYVQLLDEHGNGSPMALLGCKEVKPASLPRPVLAEPQPAGDNSNPQVALNWFCPTSGVYRFQVMIKRADHPGGGVPLGFSGPLLTPLLTYNTAASYLGLLSGPLELEQFDAALLSPPSATGFGPGPQFTLTANVLLNVPYHISVAAMDDEGNAGEPSQVWTFTWKPATKLPTVPWPTRPLPPVNAFDDAPVPSLLAVFQPRVAAVVFYNQNRQFDQLYPVGIRIGDTSQISPTPYNVGTSNFLTYQVPESFTAGPPLPPPPTINPNTLIFRRVSSNPTRNGESLLPIAIYRQQVANKAFPRVSGSLTQVTPLLEQLAYGVGSTPGVAGYTVTIYDRLIAGGTESLSDRYFGEFLYLRDQQPVLLGASYQYFVARFNDQHEISEIIPAGTVTIPTSP
jgi:hypothetical protein